MIEYVQGPHIYVDADGCPVKQEVYRVAKRYKLRVTLAANTVLRTGSDELIQAVLVEGGQDAADDWIADRVAENDIVITGDIPLASRCLKKGAYVLDHRGGVFAEERIGWALAGRELHSQLRQTGEITGGPRPFDPRHRSKFLQRLDETVNAALAKQNRFHRGGAEDAENGETD